MSKETFDRLVNSIKQAGKIERGEIESSRQFVIEIDEKLKSGLSSYKTWGIYVADEDDALVPRKIYEIEIYPHLSNVRVIDEEDEVLLCPKDWFVPIAVPQILSETLAKVA